VTLPLVTRNKGDFIFCLSRANQNEVIVTQFLISCKNTIKNSLKFLEPEYMTYEFTKVEEILVKHKIVTYKFERILNTLKQLEAFCKNKLLDYLNPDQTYGHINKYIQNVLKEQLFIEILIQALIIAFPTYELLEELKKTEQSRKTKKAKKRGTFLSPTLMIKDALMSPEKDNTIQFFSKRYSHNCKLLDNPYIAEVKEEINHRKMKICDWAYKVIMSICEKNLANQTYTFRYLPIFQMHADYIPSAIDCVNIIVKDNEELLLNLHRSNQARNNQEIDQNVFSENIKRLHNAHSYEKNLPVSPVKKDKPSNQAFSPVANRDIYERAYHMYYDRLIKYLNRDPTGVFDGWNYIQFFASLLKKTDDIEKIKKLILFFKTISLNHNTGISVNQETLFKYFTNRDNGMCIMQTNMLKLRSEGENILISVPMKQFHGKMFELKDFLENEELNPSDVQLSNLANLDKSGDSDVDYMAVFDYLSTFNEELVSNHVEFYAALCQSRNFSWRRFIEKDLKWDALIAQLKKDIPNRIKAAICRLLIALYIDQDPRREIPIPILCKIVDKKKASKE